jgi:NAD(P)-dependent dehydrogenase (short-subunit alcohol dehydrogenase family)
MNIIINGGSKGIGKEIALLLSKDAKNQIIVSGRNEPELISVAENSAFHNITTMLLDLSIIEKDLEVTKNKILNRFDKIDILINNAGYLVVKDFTDITNDEARKMMETNFFGPATFIRLVVPFMQRGSHIINISSMGGFQGSSKYNGLSYYSASKAAIANLTECLAVEFFDKGISVNCLALGSVQTEMFENAFKGFQAPVKPDLMAEFISYFALHGNRFFNGKILPVAISNP